MASKLLSIPFPVVPAGVQVQVLKCRVEFWNVSGDAGEECWLQLGLGLGLAVGLKLGLGSGFGLG